MAPHVLVPFVDSPEAKEALAYAFELFSDAEVTVIYVANESAPTDVSHRHLEEAETIAADYELPVEFTLLHGTPREEIVEFAETNDVDHIVMGSRGRSGMSRLLLGSVAETVVRRSPVPVTVVR